MCKENAYPLLCLYETFYVNLWFFLQRYNGRHAWKPLFILETIPKIISVRMLCADTLNLKKTVWQKDAANGLFDNSAYVARFVYPALSAMRIIHAQNRICRLFNGPIRNVDNPTAEAFHDTGKIIEFLSYAVQIGVIGSGVKTKRF